ALYNLRRARLLPERFTLIGVARHDKNDNTFRDELRTALHQFVPGDIAADDASWLIERARYHRGDLNDPATFARLAELLVKLDKTYATNGNFLFYLATPAAAFATVIRQLSSAGLVRETGEGWRRVIIEKPFGNDLRSAEALNRDILDVLAESQI